MIRYADREGGTMAETPPIPDKEYFSIGEVSRITQTPAYVLRYWEGEFKTLRPPRRSSGQRKYTRREIDLVFQIRELLYDKKFTIAGAKKTILGDRRKKPETQLHFQMGPMIDPAIIIEIRKELEEILKSLKSQ